MFVPLPPAGRQHPVLQEHRAGGQGGKQVCGERHDLWHRQQHNLAGLQGQHAPCMHQSCSPVSMAAPAHLSVDKTAGRDKLFVSRLLLSCSGERVVAAVQGVWRLLPVHTHLSWDPAMLWHLPGGWPGTNLCQMGHHMFNTVPAAVHPLTGWGLHFEVVESCGRHPAPGRHTAAGLPAQPGPGLTPQLGLRQLPHAQDGHQPGDAHAGHPAVIQRHRGCGAQGA